MSRLEQAVIDARRKLAAASRELVDGTGDIDTAKAARDAAKAEVAAAEKAAALSRECIGAMTVAEFDERHDEIDRWRKAGAVDGEMAPSADRPEGHAWTREEVAGLTVAAFDRHEAEIKAQMRNGGLPRKADVADAS